VLWPPHSLSALLDVTPSRTTPLCLTPLTAPHRHSHEQNHKHNRDRHHDHDDTGVNSKHDKGGAHASPPWTVAPAYLHRPSSRSRRSLRPGPCHRATTARDSLLLSTCVAGVASHDARHRATLPLSARRGRLRRRRRDACSGRAAGARTQGTRAAASADVSGRLRARRVRASSSSMAQVLGSSTTVPALLANAVVAAGRRPGPTSRGAEGLLSRQRRRSGVVVEQFVVGAVLIEQRLGLL
jgi:hypothetical protein